MNHMIEQLEASEHLRDSVRFLEKRRSKSEDFHERVVTEDELKPRTARKKGRRAVQGQPQVPARHAPPEAHARAPACSSPSRG